MKSIKNQAVGVAEMLSRASQLQHAIDAEVDWFIAYREAKKPHLKKIAWITFCEKKNERIRIAKEVSKSLNV